jgi:hypothetical protein
VPAVKLMNWRTVAAFLVFAALWWFFVWAARCDASKPRPTELIPVERPDGP